MALTERASIAASAEFGETALRRAGKNKLFSRESCHDNANGRHSAGRYEANNATRIRPQP
jgi:hypothetical protein